MKKLALVAAAVLAMNVAYSQVQFAVGIKGGPNFASLNTSESIGSNYKNRSGFHGGAFALFKFTKIGIQPEILFSQQGSKFTFNSQDVEASFDYINIPVMLKIYTIAGLNLQVGPQFGFLKGATIDSQNVKEDLKGSDVGGAVGLGWDLPFGLTIDGRYNFGISNISDDGAAQMKNQVWQVSVGFKLLKFGK